MAKSMAVDAIDCFVLVAKLYILYAHVSGNYYTAIRGFIAKNRGLLWRMSIAVPIDFRGTLLYSTGVQCKLC
jgi:hypothetical protein